MYLGASEIAARVGELGAEIARDYADREPVLVGALKACVPFVTDLSQAIPVAHALDFVELAGYGSSELGGHERIRFIKDLDLEIGGRDVIIVDEVV
ncbi:MAG TPA: phosphoribosyltransferase family protein, partial [Gaiellaceae bacterium]|nr:phosphoribosyltransferase family protein [Gaiellaceae bacterium]